MIVDDMTKKLKNLLENATEDELCNAIDDVKNAKRNKFDFLCGEIAADIRKSIIRVGHVTSVDKFSCAKSIEFAEMQNVLREFLKSVKIIGLIQGNLSVEQAKTIMQTVETNLQDEKIEEVSRISI